MGFSKAGNPVKVKGEMEMLRRVYFIIISVTLGSMPAEEMSRSIVLSVRVGVLRVMVARYR